MTTNNRTILLRNLTEGPRTRDYWAEEDAPSSRPE